ncbi:MAG: ACT domain protein [Cocleimonas sp.]|nr:ACT domain protein [Cocleimonas sp.]
MQSSLIITILGADRSGLVKSLSEMVKNNKGNWQESRMVRMDGQFAGLAHVSIATEHAESLSQALLSLQSDDLQVLIKQSKHSQPSAKILSIELLGSDRQGIIHEITQQLSALNVNIEKLQSEQRIAPMSNETLFYAEIELGLPEGVTEEDIQDVFEKISDSLMVELTFSR